MTVLIVAGAPIQNPGAYRDILTSAEEIIAVDSGADLVFALGRTPDLFVGDADSVSVSSMNAVIEGDIPRILLPADKDVSDLEVALSEALRVADRSIRVTAVLGGRSDHMLVAVGAMFAAATNCAIAVVEPSEHAWFLSATGQDTLTLAPRYSLVSVVAGPSGASVSMIGFRWELDGVHLDPFSGRGLSNLIAQDSAKVHVHSGVVMVLSPRVDCDLEGDSRPASAL